MADFPKRAEWRNSGAIHRNRAIFGFAALRMSQGKGLPLEALLRQRSMVEPAWEPMVGRLPRKGPLRDV